MGALSCLTVNAMRMGGKLFRDVYRVYSVQMSTYVKSKVLKKQQEKKLDGFRFAMDEQEAFKILNIPKSSTKAIIKKAHRNMMQLNHPDMGGSAFLAIKINQAKDFLVKKR